MNKQLKKMIDHADVVSFDVFDTLIYRSRYDIQDIYIKTALYLEMDIDRYLNSRLIAESVAMKKNNGKPVNIEKVFKYVDCQGKSKKDVIEKELQIEVQNLKQNQEMYKIYKYCIETKKEIIITSDMYMNKDTISLILKKCGYLKFDSMFVSSEFEKSKYKGDLFDEIKKQYVRKKVLHIGDAKRSDYLNAKIHGLSAFRYKADYSRNKYYGIGYRRFGNLFSAFKIWLDDNMDTSEYDHIFFLAREGLFLKKIYGLDKATDDSIYLYVSRRSLTVPRLYHNNKYEDLEKIIVFSSAFTAKTFLNRLGLEKTDEEILNKTGISPTHIFYKNSYLSDEKLRNLYAVFYDEIVLNAKSEWTNLIQYLKNNSFEGRVAIVDIGWNGTMQNALQNIINEANLAVNRLDGYYLGINAQNIKHGSARGFLYENKENNNSIKVAGSYGLFELITLAHHGSVKCYSSDKYNSPILYEYNNDVDINNDLKKIEILQEGILDYVKNNVSGNDIDWNIFIEPSKSDIKFLGNLPFFDANYSRLINSSDLIKYLTNPRKFKEDFYLSVWKIGFLKKIFKLQLPYYKVYEKMKK
ncbi:hypothetical protein [Blautia massiliensis (ex Liu et al. 2021)]|uniref:hypothetical protein n=1 Tax=Blautia massiliensis (ex Liu et al. 2021) TaxID=3062492 RepID=UPI003F8BB356